MGAATSEAAHSCVARSWISRRAASPNSSCIVRSAAALTVVKVSSLRTYSMAYHSRHILDALGRKVRRRTDQCGAWGHWRPRAPTTSYVAAVIDGLWLPQTHSRETSIQGDQT